MQLSKKFHESQSTLCIFQTWRILMQRKSCSKFASECRRGEGHLCTVHKSPLIYKRTSEPTAHTSTRTRGHKVQGPARPTRFLVTAFDVLPSLFVITIHVTKADGNKRFTSHRLWDTSINNFGICNQPIKITFLLALDRWKRNNVRVSIYESSWPY